MVWADATLKTVMRVKSKSIRDFISKNFWMSFFWKIIFRKLQDEINFTKLQNLERIYDYSRKYIIVGKKVCTFKGEEVLLKIRDLKDKDDTNNLSNFINSNLAEHIYKCILQVVNYKYGNNNTETQTSGTRKEVIFL